MSHLSRRRFLEDSMLAATAALSTGTVGRLMAKENTAGSKSANERLSVGCVGVNGQGKAHLNNYASRPDTEVTFICDVDEAVGMREVERIGEMQGRKPVWVRDLRELYDNPTVDLISIATPNHWHALAAIWALQAGKDVYVEKPVSHNVSEGRRIVETARKHNKICQTGTQCRSMSGTRAAIDYIKSGKIGEVKMARGLCYKSRKSIGPRGTYDIPASVDYNLWSGPVPMDPLTRPKLHYDWHWQWPTGNGDLGNQGIHQMDVCRWGLGVDDLGKGVYSYGGRLGYEDAGDTANTQVAWFDYGDKSLCFEVRGLDTDAYRVMKTDPGAKVGTVFYGSDGYVVMSSYVSAAAFDLDGKMVEEFKGGEYADHFANFINATRTRNIDDLNADIEKGHVSSALCHLANISYRLGKETTVAEARERMQGAEAQETYGRFAQHLADNGLSESTPISWGEKLTVDAPSETFVDNEAANAMLTREYRAPFVVPAAGQV